MNLTCQQCHHQWNEDVKIGQTIVICPECMAEMPIALAASGTSPAATSIFKPSAPSVSSGAPFLSTAPRPKGVEDDFSLEYMYNDTVSPPASTEAESSASDNLQTLITPPPGSPAQASAFDRTVVTPPPEPPRPGARPAPATPAPAADWEKQTTPPQPLRPPHRTDAERDAHNTDAAVHPAQTDAAHSAVAIGASIAAAVADAPPAVSGGATPAADELKRLIGRNVDGYVIEKLLGAGGMGAVFLAHQVSLDRKVALKVLPKKFSSNPELIARFTREALAAAQLNHHNIIQVYDVGNTGDLHYIAMEFVKGRNLGEMIRKEGRLQIDDAAAFVLQAARGLKYAHDRGIIHRDIKPDNLMVNEHGIVKVADMGLAKWRKDVRDEEQTRIRSAMAEADNRSILERAASDMTMANVAMGTPAYMAPEQARDAASAGPAADQYSLGCTLYYLCAGKAPYSGTTAFDLISKHMNEPLTPLDVHVKTVPTALNGIVKKMLEKEPSARYSHLGALINDLEAYLGVESEKGPYTPRELHLAVLEECVSKFYAAPKIKLRRFVRLGFFTLMPILLAAALLLGQFPFAGGVLALLILTPLFTFALNGILAKEYLFRRVRSVVFGMPIKSWFATAGCAILVVLLLVILKWWMWWLIFAVIAAGLAVVWYFAIVAPLRAQRRAPIERTQQMLKELRVRGVSEDALMDFVCRFSPANWEEFFEELFGYENTILARGKWAAADKVKPRKKFALWRDPLARWLEQIEEQRKETREKKHLKKAEVNRLKARGVSAKEAEHAAELEATRVMTEGLIKHVPEDKPRARHRVSFSPLIKLGGWALRGVALALGLYVAAVSLAFIVWAFKIYDASFVMAYAPAGFFTWNASLKDTFFWILPGVYFTAAAGLMLAAMAFSRRNPHRFLAILGVSLMIAYKPIIELAQQPSSMHGLAFLTGVGLILFGFGSCALAKYSGGRF